MCILYKFHIYTKNAAFSMKVIDITWNYYKITEQNYRWKSFCRISYHIYKQITFTIFSIELYRLILPFHIILHFCPTWNNICNQYIVSLMLSYFGFSSWHHPVQHWMYCQHFSSQFPRPCWPHLPLTCHHLL